jgi:hypothetical protein
MIAAIVVARQPWDVFRRQVALSEWECMLLFAYTQTKIDDLEVFLWKLVLNGVFMLHHSIDDCHWNSQSLKRPTGEFWFAGKHVWGKCSQLGWF